MNNSTCPACKNVDNTFELEEINLDFQHKMYAPGNPSVQQKLSSAARELVDSYKMLKCNNCGLEFSCPLVAPNRNWYKYAYEALSLYPTNRWEFDYVLNFVHLQDNICEFGCGSGYFLEKCMSKDIKCKGYDFSETAIEICLKNSLPVSIMDLSDHLDNNSTESQRFTNFVAFHVLEHLDRPNMLFEQAKKYSKDKSTFWLSIPSNKRATRVFDEKDFLDQPPHHLTRWNKKSLMEIGELNGWILEDLVYEPIPIFTIFWYYSTRSLMYKSIIRKINNSSILAEKMLRFFLLPYAILKWLRNKDEISGFSMLAKFKRLEV